MVFFSRLGVKLYVSPSCCDSRFNSKWTKSGDSGKWPPPVPAGVAERCPGIVWLRPGKRSSVLHSVAARLRHVQERPWTWDRFNPDPDRRSQSVRRTWDTRCLWTWSPGWS